MTRARVTRRHPSKANGRLNGLGWSFGHWMCRGQVKFNTGWVVDVLKSVEKKKSVAGQFAVKYKSGTYC
jgi:hypothetical protein